MADNLTTQSATPATVPSSSVIATDEVSGVHFQRVKLVDGTADSNVAIAGDATNGLDVDVTRVQGTVTVADGGTTLSVDDGGGSLTVDGTVAVSGSVAVTGPLTDAQLRATAVPVSGTVAITDGSGPVTVDGSVSVSNFPATQPVSGNVGIDSTTNTVKIDSVTNTVKLDAGQVSTLTPPTSVGISGTANTVKIDSTTNTVQLATNTSVGLTSTGNTVKIDQTGTNNQVAISSASNTVKIDAGTAGTPLGSVVSVQGVTNGTNISTTQVPLKTNGLKIYRYVSASGSADTKLAVGSQCNIYGWSLSNTGSTPAFIKLYNKSGTAPVIGTDSVAMTLIIPANTSGAGHVAAEFTNGIQFSSGVGHTITTAAGDSSVAYTTNAAEVVINIFYRD